MMLPIPYYKDNWTTIYNANCEDILPLIKKVDLFICDPPYELCGGGGSDRYFGDSHRKIKRGLENINKGYDINILNLLVKICFPFQIFIFCSNKQISKTMNFFESKNFMTTLLIWNKYNAIPLTNNTWIPDIEYVIHSKETNAIFNGNFTLKHKVDRLPINVCKYNHPTEKPIELIKKYIRIGSNPNQIVCDMFFGSGTTLVASKMLGRKSIGIEIEKKILRHCY